jgi:hypothetical protein
MRIPGLLMIGCLAVAILVHAQAGKPPTARPAPTKPTPKPTAVCGLPKETYDVLGRIMNAAGFFSDNPQIDGPEVSEVMEKWRISFKEASTCVGTAIDTGDVDSRLLGTQQEMSLLLFRTTYYEVKYNREASFSKQLLDQNQKQASELANLQKIVNRPYINEPRPIHMTCTPTGGCNGEILIPNARSSDTPFHMTCRSGVGQAECDGDLMP